MRTRLLPSFVVALLTGTTAALAQQGAPYGGSYPYGSPPPGGQAPAPYAGQSPYGAQPGAYPQQGAYTPPPQQGPPQAAPPARPASRDSSLFELGTLYAAAAGYGVGLGIWLDSEFGLSDPGLMLIPPAVLGVGAPVGVYFLDQPTMPRGKPAAIAAGLAIGAGEGLGIAGTQFVTSDKADAWGFRGLARSVALGATLGGVGGYVLGEVEEPSPKLSAFAMSGVVWGTLIGGAIGYGASPAGVGYGKSNDSGAIGGLIGFNVGLAGAAGLSMLFVPSWEQITGMWVGTGIGAAVSLPVFLFYGGDNTPPAKRGLVFTGTAMALGMLAGAVFSSGDSGSDSAEAAPEPGQGFASLSYVAPMPLPGGAGVAVGGLLE